MEVVSPMQGVNAFDKVEKRFKGQSLLLPGIDDIDTTYKTHGIGTLVMLRDLRKVGTGDTCKLA